MREVAVGSVPLDRLATLLDEDRAERLADHARRARRLLADRIVWNVNATATGGGVAEMLQALLDYAHGAGVDTRWLVLDGTPDFFALTKRLHNRLHGAAGDGGPLGAAERTLYDAVLADNLEQLTARVRPGDIVLLHDPQTAGLVPGMAAAGAHVAWRCHIGRDTPHPLAEEAWEFLRADVEAAEMTIFSREAYAPPWISRDRLWVIPPSLDPFSAKNCELTPDDVRAALRHTQLTVEREDGGSLAFVRRDGSPGLVRPHEGLLLTEGAVPLDARIVMQVSRWDGLKDMAGVMAGFVRCLPRIDDDVHLMLVGPAVSGVSDDPEGAAVLDDCLADWRALDPAAQRRVHLCSLPMDDVDENALLVNALQRRAEIVVQKSLVEGFGLTVTEPMWKGKPVIASRVGGIQDQITHEADGLLLDDPTDLDAFADALVRLLGDRELAQRLGTAAQRRIRERFLGDRHLIQYVELFRRMLADPPAPDAAGGADGADSAGGADGSRRGSPDRAAELPE